MREERKIDHLTRGDFEKRDLHRVELRRAFLVEWRGEKEDAALRAMGLDLPQRLRRQLQPADHFEMRLLAAGRRRLILRLGCGRADEALRFESLKLHRIRTGICSSVHEAERQLGAAVVVHASLGNDETRLTWANATAGDFDGRHCFRSASAM